MDSNSGTPIYAFAEPADGTISPSDVWLEGDVLMCSCPDCCAPMSVRAWLMVADCWLCGTSIELTEQQEREAERLLAERERKRHIPKESQTPASISRVSTSSTNGGSAAATPPVSPLDRDHRQLGLVRPGVPPVALPPLTSELCPANASTPIDVPLPHARRRIGDFFRNMPAWIVSFVFHLILLTLLGLITFESEKPSPRITLSLAVSHHVKEGDAKAWLAPDEVKFDLPIPEDEVPHNRREMEAMIQADLDARQLRIDRQSTDPHLPDVDRVRQMIVSPDYGRRAFAVRDPRMRVEMVKREGGTTLTEAAVSRGLRWMAEHQSSDGSWSLHRFHRHPDCRGRCRGAGQIRSDAAGTSLVLLPFLGAGQTHLTGYYRDVVSAGLRWLLEHQRPDGDLRFRAPYQAGMYVHGQATIVLSEVLGMTQDETFREPAQRAVDFIVSAQHPDGGWRYRPGQAGDTSVLGWQLMALQSARAAGLQVPEETLETAGHYLDRVGSRDGALYAYQPGNRPSPAMTAEALLCRVYLGWREDNPGLLRGIDYLLDQHMPSPDKTNFYYWYYATQAMHHVGGAEWERWNLRMREVLIATQQTRGHQAGSWTPRGGHAYAGGRIYTTALAVCSLEVYYRHAPIFRQIKLN